jgi:hypothetical protein
MFVDTHTLIWLFPIVFMMHDFEEIILGGEPWLRKNAGEVKALVEERVPAFPAKQIGSVLDKTAAELSFPISLIFGLTVVSAYLAVTHEAYGFLLLASAVFFLHGFMHLGQALILRRYIPAVITSAVFVIPCGLVLYARLIHEGTVDPSGLLICSLPAAILAVPFILVTHKAEGFLYEKSVRLLIE